MEFFDVHVARFDVPEERAVRGLMQVFGLSEASARIFVRSLPRMGKRRVPLEAAQRYANALSKIGAVVECRRTQPLSLYPAAAASPSEGHTGGPAGSPTSLPPPRASFVPTYAVAADPTPGDAPAGIAHASHASHAAHVSHAWQPSHAAYAQAQHIPGAARVPRELAPQAFAASEQGAQQPHAADSYADAMFAHSQRPAAQSGPPLDGSHAPILADHVGIASSQAPQPSSTPAPRVFSSHPPEPPSARKWVIAAALLAGALVGAVLYARSLGFLHTEVERRARAFRNDGIEAATHVHVQAFLAREGHRFEGIADADLRALIEGLGRAGAKSIWAVRVREQAGSVISRDLVVELPTDPAARRTIFFQHARTAGARAIAEDHGQRYLELRF